METLSALVGSFDDSSCNASTGPTTPESSPFFRPVLVEDVVASSLSHLLEDDIVRNLKSVEPCGISPVVTAQHGHGVRSTVRNITFIGAGYVGGPTAAVIALHNPDVRVEVLDRDQVRVDEWNSQHLPIHEKELNKVVRIARDGADMVKRTSDPVAVPGAETVAVVQRRPNLTFTTNAQASISKADIVFLAVNTPTKSYGMGAGRATDMVAIDGAVKLLSAYARPGTIVVEKSTVPCGTAQRISQMLRMTRPGVSFEILSNPEFLAEGQAIENLMSPDRVLIGSSNSYSGRCAAAALSKIYQAWIPPSKILETNVWSSELSKLVANAMLAQRISSINSISAICEVTGADVDEIARSIGLDRRIGSKFLKAGLGFGGSCFRKDIASLVYLAESLGLEDVAHYWSQVNAINDAQRTRFARKVIRRLDDSLAGKKIAILGFAFKKNTGDPRESLAVDIIRVLAEEIPSEIAIFDPCCRRDDIKREIGQLGESRMGPKDQQNIVQVYENPYQACADANAVLIITDCDEFRYHAVDQKDATHTKVAIKGKDCDVFETDGMRFRLLPETPCSGDCQECSSSTGGCAPGTVLDWENIAYGMKEPKWVFDGRGILDIQAMEKLSLRVDSIGKKVTPSSDWC